MATSFNYKLISNLSKKRKEGGFTLIELLVVVIIIGVLAAVALPNLLGQVGKARETEGKNAVGTLNRAQQSYHFEKQLFATVNDTDLEDPTNALGVVIKSEVFDNINTVGNAGADATSQALSTDAQNQGVRQYEGQIAYDAGNYTTILCQSDAIAGTTTADATAGTCATGTALK